jgi:hypothetical protein
MHNVFLCDQIIRGLVNLRYHLLCRVCYACSKACSLACTNFCLLHLLCFVPFLMKPYFGRRPVMVFVIESVILWVECNVRASPFEAERLKLVKRI